MLCSKCLMLHLILIWQVNAILHNDVTIKHNFIQKYAKFYGGTRLYCCTRKDAMSLLRQYSNSSVLVNSELLDKINGTKDNRLSVREPQIMELFVDLTCRQGESFLKQSRDLFNSSYRWLLWTEDYNAAMDLLAPCRILVDSNVLMAVTGASSSTTTVYELYRMHYTQPIIANKLHEWISNATTISSVQISTPAARTDFMGAVISGVILILDPEFANENYVELMLNKSFKPGFESSRRFGLPILLHIAEFYNFTYKSVFTQTGGEPLGNGSYTGIVGFLQRKEVEVGMTFLLFATSRLALMDYIDTTAFTRISMTFLQPKRFGSYKSLIAPLSTPSWITLLLTLLTGAILVKVVAIFDTMDINETWSDSFLVVLSAMAGQGVPENAEKLGNRLLHITILNFTFIVAIYYSVSLLSSLLLPVPSAIQNMDQLLDSDYNFIVENLPFLENYINTNNDTVTKRFRQKIKTQSYQSNLHVDPDQGFAKIQSGQFAILNFPFEHYEKMDRLFSDNEKCSVMEIDKVGLSPVGAVLQNDSPYRKIFKKKFQLMREVGILGLQRNYWIPNRPVCHYRQDTVVVGIKGLTVAYLVIGTGMLTSLVAAVCEILYKKFNRNPIIVQTAISFHH